MLVRFHRIPTLLPASDSLFTLEKEIGSLFDGFFGTDALGSRGLALDMTEEEHASVITAELPGVKREDVKLTLHDGVLTLSAERKETRLPEEARWVRNEIATGRFSRSITLPHDVEEKSVSAELKDGILRVVLPKAESARPKEIKVQ